MNNEENHGISQEEIDSLKAQQAGKDLVDTAGKVAANYLAPGGGGKVYDAVAKTEAGQKILNTAGNVMSQAPLARNVLSKAQPAISEAKPAADMALGSKMNSASQASSAMSSSNQLDDKSNDVDKITDKNLDGKQEIGAGKDNNPSSQDSFSSSTDAITKLIIKKNKFPLFIGIALGFFFLIILTLTMEFYNVKITPFEMVTQPTDKLLNFVSGCGWSTDEECAEKQQNNFYNYVNEKYDEYKNNYSVELDKYLIIATLTYSDPFLTTNPEMDENGVEKGSSTVNYRKSKNQVDYLIANMAKQVDAKCYLYDKFGNSEQVPCSEKNNYSTQLNSKEKYWVVRPIYILTPDEYRNYLEETFVIKYYLDNDKTDENKDLALDIVEEIYETADYYKSLASEEQDTTEVFVNNEVKVVVMDCPGNITLEQVSLTDYLQGVLYMNSENDSEDYLKFLAVAAKNNLYNLNGANANSMPQTLRIRNCKETQLYCNIDEGCHYMDGNGSDDDTLVSGSDNDGKYSKLPLTNVENISKIEQAVDETISDFIIDGDNFVSTSLSSINKSEVLNQLYNNDYTDVLTNVYGGTIGEVDLFVSGYPLDTIHNNVTSGFGWRRHPIKIGNKYECRHHNGTDIAATYDANIYSIADGVVVEIGYNPNLQIGLGHYIKIGHGNLVNGYYDYYSVYGHMNRPPVLSVGDSVEIGQVIGYVGNTGASTGNHLHIEIYSYINGEKVSQDPVDSFKNVQLTGVTGPMYSSQAQCNSYN